MAFAEDLVITSSASDLAARIKKAGEILDYTGAGIRLRTKLGRDETIPASRIVEVQTTWTAAHLAGDKARLAGKLDEAIASYQRAKSDEPRPWAVRRTSAELSSTYLEAGRIDEAGEEFLAIVASDPATPHFDIFPVAWRAMPLSLTTHSRAVEWLADKNRPAARLLGAGWLLASDKQAVAQAALEELTRAADRRVASIATSQLWRTEKASAAASHVALWQSELEQQPPECQAAAWYVLGDLAAGLDEPSQAALAYLKVPILFRRQRAIAAEALLAAGQQLEKSGKSAQAAELYREIVRDFSHLPPAGDAAKRLAALKGP